MTISNTIRTAGPFIGNGITTAFPFTFKVFKKEEVLAVQTDTSTGVASSLVLNSAYSVTLNADQNATPGGTVTTSAPLAIGQTLVLTSDLAYLQPLDITNGGGFYPSVLNAALDRLTIFCQQLFSLARRSIKFPLSDAGMDTELPSAVARANKMLGFDSAGRPIVAAPLSGSAADVAIDLANFQASLYMQTYAAIRAYVGVSPYVYVYTAGIAGPFIRTADTTSVDDGGLILVAVNGVRWKRLFSGAVHIDWFAAFGVGDSKPAVQAAIAAVEAMGGGFLTARAGATYTLGSGLTWNASLVGFDMNGATLDFSAMLSGIALLPHQTGIEVNSRTGSAQGHPWSNGTIRGYDFTRVSLAALRFEDLSSDAVIAGVTFIGVRFQKFAVDVQFSRGSFFETFTRCVFQGVPGAGLDTTYSIQFESAVNSGEANTFNECLMGGRNFGIDQNNGGCDTRMNSCRFDFFGQTAITVSAGKMFICGGHIEARSDVAHLVQCAGQNSAIFIDGIALVLELGMTSFSPFFSDPTCLNGGVIVRDVACEFGGTLSTYFCAGTGRTDIQDVLFPFANSKPLLSAYQNKLTYGDFESANFAADWSLSGGGGTAPFRNNTITPKSGAFCLQFTGGVGFIPGATATFECSAGQQPSVEAWYLSTILSGTGATFYGQLAYVDRLGNVLSGGEFINTTTTNATWQRGLGQPATPAPPGTYGFRISISVFGTTSGVPNCFIDAVSVTIT